MHIQQCTLTNLYTSGEAPHARQATETAYLASTAVDKCIEKWHNGGFQVNFEAVVLGRMMTVDWQLVDNMLQKD